MVVDEHFPPLHTPDAAAAAAASIHLDVGLASSFTSMDGTQATSPLGASSTAANGLPDQPRSAQLPALGNLEESHHAEALAHPVDSPVPLAVAQPDRSAAATKSDGKPRKEGVSDPALQSSSSTAAPESSAAQGLPLAEESLTASQQTGGVTAQNNDIAVAQPHAGPLQADVPTANAPAAAEVMPAASRSSGDGLKVQLPPIRTHSPTNSSPTTLGGPLRTAKSGQSWDSPRSRPLEDLDDIENSPPPMGASPTRREVSQLTARVLKRMSGRSMKKSDSNISLASISSQGSAGHSPSSRRSPLGLLRHLAHATIRRGFASHSTPNLAAMAADATAGDDISSQQGMGMPEWARQPHYEPHMESVTEDAQEGLTTPLGSLQQRTVFGTPRREHFSRKALQPRSMADPTDSEPAPLSPISQAFGFDGPPMVSARSGDSGGLGTRAGGSMLRQTSQWDGEDAWDTMWSATPWDAALVGMASMRMGAGQRPIAGTHPMGMGGWEQGSGHAGLHAGQLQAGPQHGLHTGHRATFTGGLQSHHHAAHQPMINSQVRHGSALAGDHVDGGRKTIMHETYHQ